MLQHERPRPGAGAGRLVHDRDDREDLPAVLLCLDARAAAAHLAPGRWRARRARPAGPRGIRAERAVRLRGGRVARLRRRGAVPVLRPDAHLAAGLVRAAPRGRHQVIGAAAGLAIAGHGHRAVAAALGVPAATVRGWLRRLRARAGQLRAHAIGELNGLGFTPRPPSEPPAPLATR